MIEVADDAAFSRFMFLELLSVYRNGDNSWRCETKCERIMQIRIKHGIVHMAIAEREDDLLDEYIVLNTKNNKYKVDNFVNNLLNKTKVEEQITFNKIKDYMGWAVEEDNVWE